MDIFHKRCIREQGNKLIGPSDILKLLFWLTYALTFQNQTSEAIVDQLRIDIARALLTYTAHYRDSVIVKLYQN